MATLKITLTEDMLKLLSWVNLKVIPVYDDEVKGKETVCFDFDGLYGGSFLFEDMSYILGCYDKHIEGTENYPLGPQFPKEVEDYLWETHRYIVENFIEIEEIIHQFSSKGGIKATTYTCKANEHIWKEEN